MPLLILTVIYVLSYVDRQIVNILAEGIKRDLGLTDAQLGLVTGLSFALLYAGLGVPIARLAEKQHRVRIISIAVFTWSAFTVACGFARNATDLFLMRVGVGIGEAGSTPPSHSLIAEYYPPEKRASAIGIYSLGIPIGSMIGTILGGVALYWVGWRGAFIIAGAPGLLMAVIAWIFLPEPRANRGWKVRPDNATRVSLLSAVRSLWNVRSYPRLVAGMTLFSLYGYSAGAFGASFIFRNHAEELDRWSVAIRDTAGLDLGPSGTLGLISGLMIGAAGIIGTISGGKLADKLGRSSKAAYAEIASLSVLAVVPCYLLVLFLPSLSGVFLAMMAASLTGSFIFGPVYGSIQSIAPIKLRATASAVTLLVVNLVALGFGPLTVGILSDIFAGTVGEGDGLTYALLVVCPLALLAGSAALWSARKTIEQDYRASEAS